jgi:anti-sigma factor RsiW
MALKAQHLSDEAIAAFADGVLRGPARERATRHTEKCPECRAAVKVQREAAWALRTSPTPALPTALVERLQSVPQTTRITPAPTVLGPDGSPMLATMWPMAAFVPPTRQSRRTGR